jgi:hypothetical protein
MSDRSHEASDPGPAPGSGADGDLLEVLGEQYSAAILSATDEPRSARELSDLLDVPIATCYRRIEDLVAVDLLAERGRELSDRGRRTSVYRRTVEELSVSFDEGAVDVSVEAWPGDGGLTDARATER